MLRRKLLNSFLPHTGLRDVSIFCLDVERRLLGDPFQIEGERESVETKTRRDEQERDPRSLVERRFAREKATSVYASHLIPKLSSGKSSRH